MPKIATLILLFFSFTFTQCAHYKLNKPLEKYDPKIHDKWDLAKNSKRSNDLNFILAFSGGGTRAAALAYGVLETLEDIKIPDLKTGKRNNQQKSRTLLDEVDYISSVSGGSFVSAYYALHGKKIFDNFEEDFLHKNVQRGIFLRMLSPINWVLFFSPYYSRSDMAANYYDKILFNGATFGDLESVKKRPIINFQATDIVEGSRFSFSHDQFANICSDLNEYSISRGVTASSAFPGAFSAITLENYGGTCGFEVDPWTKKVLKNRSDPGPGFHAALRFNMYQDREKKKFIHLMDGGISDNLGVRDPLERTLYGKHREKRLEMHPRRTAVIIVNAQTKTRPEWNLIAKTPGLGEVMNAASATMINSYNFETVELLRNSFEDNAQRIDRLKQGPYDYYIIEVSFDALHDEAERESFSDISTSLKLPIEDVTRLRLTARKILLESEKFKTFVKDIGGSLEPVIEPFGSLTQESQIE